MKLLFVLLLSGCASMPPGVVMTDAEIKACGKANDCTVWTKEELGALVLEAMKRGYQVGRQNRGLSL